MSSHVVALSCERPVEGRQEGQSSAARPCYRASGSTLAIPIATYDAFFTPNRFSSSCLPSVTYAIPTGSSAPAWIDIPTQRAATTMWLIVQFPFGVAHEIGRTSSHNQ